MYLIIQATNVEYEVFVLLSLERWKKEEGRTVLRLQANFVFPRNRHKDFMVIRLPDQRQAPILHHP